MDAPGGCPFNGERQTCERLRGERGQIVKVKKILRMSMEIDKMIKGNCRVRLRWSLVYLEISEKDSERV